MNKFFIRTTNTFLVVFRIIFTTSIENYFFIVLIIIFCGVPYDYFFLTYNTLQACD